MSHKKFYLKAMVCWLGNLTLPRDRVFRLGATDYRYFSHIYNLTWLNERAVEIPLLQPFVAAAGGRVLEVGHVLNHYDSTLRHDVVDKYESSDYPALFREDALGFRGRAPYDLVLSISTLEHVGWDETPKDPAKVGRTIQHLQTLLAPGGRFFFTVPMGYNPGLDAFLDDPIHFVQRRCLKRVSIRNEWREVEWADIRHARFHHPYPFANGLVLAELGPRPA